MKTISSIIFTLWACGFMMHFQMGLLETPFLYLLTSMAAAFVGSAVGKYIDSKSA